MKQYHVYIMASRYHGATYIGVSSDLNRRVTQHKVGEFKGYTYEWDIKMLVYFEEFGHIEDAIAREKELKKWQRQWKFDLIETINPDWNVLFE